MKEHIITDEEARRFNRLYLSKAEALGTIKAALLDFLTNRPKSTLGKLRPIAEMTETVPEGCMRLMGCETSDQGWKIDQGSLIDTHFIDIQLPTPDPEAEERQRFEEALKAKYPAASLLRDNDGDYISDATSYSWDGFKIRAELAKAK